MTLEVRRSAEDVGVVVNLVVRRSDMNVGSYNKHYRKKERKKEKTGVVNLKFKVTAQDV